MKIIHRFIFILIFLPMMFLIGISTIISIPYWILTGKDGLTSYLCERMSNYKDLSD